MHSSFRELTFTKDSVFHPVGRMFGYGRGVKLPEPGVLGRVWKQLFLQIYQDEERTGYRLL